MSQEVDADAGEPRRGDEENQRNIDFIIRQQAQFAADMQQLRESQARSEQKWERTAEGINALLAIAEIHDREIRSLAEVQAEAQARTDRQMSETDERLNALVNVVERLISERRNGGAGAS
jgi:Spy/CpxP family protein refolding chaperone